MSCEMIRRLLPLAAGGDLSPGKLGKVMLHLENCTECRREFQAFSQVLDETRGWLSREREEWSEGEWKDCIRQAVREKAPKTSPLVPWPFPKVWAFGLMVAASLLLFLTLSGPPAVRQALGLAGVSPTGVPQESGGQDVITMTLVSQETGLKIKWFFNKDFEWKENK